MQWPWWDYNSKLSKIFGRTQIRWQIPSSGGQRETWRDSVASDSHQRCHSHLRHQIYATHYFFFLSG